MTGSDLRFSNLATVGREQSRVGGRESWGPGGEAGSGGEPWGPSGGRPLGSPRIRTYHISVAALKTASRGSSHFFQGQGLCSIHWVISLPSLFFRSRGSSQSSPHSLPADVQHGQEGGREIRGARHHHLRMPGACVRAHTCAPTSMRVRQAH